MSVWVTAIFRHDWPAFSSGIVEEIARSISSESGQPKWRPYPKYKSPEEEYSAQQVVSFGLPGNFNLKFGKRLLVLGNTDRWSTFLINETKRRHFLAACIKVARMTGAKDFLVLPEGTEVLDLFYDSAGFDQVKQAAQQKWGPPNLNIHQIYTKDEITRTLGLRVDYFVLNTSDCAPEA